MSPDKIDDDEDRLTEFVKSEVALINKLVAKVLAAEVSREQREDDMRAIIGHSYRLGGMLMETHQGRARKTEAGRTARQSNKKQRDQIIDELLRGAPNKAVKKIKPAIDEELQQRDLAVASLAYLYGRRKKILGLTDEES